MIDRLAANDIDLTTTPVEVAPIAHYHMGGVAAEAMTLGTDVAGLYVAGEVVGGANGANRLSGNALTEAFVFGRRAGKSAAEHVRQKSKPALRLRDAVAALDLVRGGTGQTARTNPADMIAHLQAAMADGVGPLRTGAKLDRAHLAIAELHGKLGEAPPGSPRAFDPVRLDWFDLRNMIDVASMVASAARARLESRGAHQREDFPQMLPQWQLHQQIVLRGGRLTISGAPDGAGATGTAS